MHTPAHLLTGAAAFARPERGTRLLWAAFLGGLVPDVPMCLMVGWALWVRGLAPEVVFDQLYFSDSWQRVFAIDHSLILWGALVLATRLVWRRVGWAVFAASGLLHAVMDFALHHDDARRQLWPLSDHVFHSPFSYWDRAYHAGIIAPAELILSLVCALILWRRFSTRGARLAIALIAAAELLPGLIFSHMF